MRTRLVWVPVFTGTTLARHFLRVDVVADPHEHRRPQVIVLGPVLEGDLGDDRRLDPRRRRVEERLLDEGTRLRLQRLEPRLDRGDAAIVEARAHVRGEVKLPAAPVADQDRAERSARALALRIAADHEIGAAGWLHLDPRAR